MYGEDKEKGKEPSMELILMDKIDDRLRMHTYVVIVFQLSEDYRSLSSSDESHGCLPACRHLGTRI